MMSTIVLETCRGV